MVPVLIQVLQSLVVLVFAPLYAGCLGRAEAVVASKRGPSILQPYRDLAKLLRKAARSATRPRGCSAARRSSRSPAT